MRNLHDELKHDKEGTTSNKRICAIMQDYVVVLKRVHTALPGEGSIDLIESSDDEGDFDPLSEEE